MSLRETKRDATRNRILENAKLLFSSKTYADVCIDELAYACEISKPTLYNYFESKQDIAVQIAAGFHRGVTESVSSRMNAEANAIEQALVFVEEWSRYLRINKQLYTALYASNAFSSLGSEKQLTMEAELFGVFRKICKQRLSEGPTIADHSSGELALLFASTIFSCSVVWARRDKSFNLKAMLEKHVRLILQ